LLDLNFGVLSLFRTHPVCLDQVYHFCPIPHLGSSVLPLPLNQLINLLVQFGTIGILSLPFPQFIIIEGGYSRLSDGLVQGRQLSALALHHRYYILLHSNSSMSIDIMIANELTIMYCRFHHHRSTGRYKISLAIITLSYTLLKWKIYRINKTRKPKEAVASTNRNNKN
jgi:hypothetical protein